MFDTEIFESPHKVGLRRERFKGVVIVGSGERNLVGYIKPINFLRAHPTVETAVVLLRLGVICGSTQREQVIETMLGLIAGADNLLIAAVIGPKGIKIPRNINAVGPPAVEVSVITEG